MFHAYPMCTFSTATLKGDPSLIINIWGRQLLRNIEKHLATVPNDTTKRCSLGSLHLLIYHIYKSSSNTPRVSVSFPIPHRYNHTLLNFQEDQKLPMDVVWSEYDTFYIRSVCMKSPSIYIIMERLSRITGLEWDKMYEKLHTVLIWSPQKGTSCRFRKPHRSTANQRIIYSS